LKLQRDFSYCENGKLIGKTLSWEQLSQKLGHAKSEELKRQLLDCEALRITTYQVNNAVGAALTKNNMTIP
jgi:hypothetical protein